ncbi:SRPBCC domain-containing protein [Pseudolabrys sp. FHR47]|uniref:SRPBCC domain-containing protein n=1 Tax=Pseudolabrys sp. FHR47 TaxID=2562284 RepID=UPI00351A68AB
MDTAVKPGISPSLTLKRRFSAPPEKVFAAWTDPQKMMRWMGPQGAIRCEARNDLRVGGRYDITMIMADDEHNVGGVYREIVPNEKLVFTWAWRSTPERESLVTVTVKPDGAGSLMTLLHEQFFDEAARDRHNEGWTGTMLRLETFLHTDGMEKPHGKFVWNELNTRDVEGAKRFLGATLGWTFEASPMPNFTYWVIKKGDERIGGIFDLSSDTRCRGVPEHWLTYIAVDDVDARLKVALAAGAREGRPPQDIPGVGRMAVLQQPGGAMVAWLTPKPM